MASWEAVNVVFIYKQTSCKAEREEKAALIVDNLPAPFLQLSLDGINPVPYRLAKIEFPTLAKIGRQGKNRAEK